MITPNQAEQSAMPNRFTITEKWDDKWFRSLTVDEKLLFNYFCDKCNLAGFLEIDTDKIVFDTGLTGEEVLGALKGLSRGLLGANDWIWVKNFLRHQKNLPLNPENNAHKHIISKINEQSERFGLTKITAFLGANEGLFSPIGKGKGKGNKGVQGENLFEQFWIEYPKKKSKGDAENAWKTLKPNGELVVQIVASLKILKTTEQWQKGKCRYVPFPATWLRAKGWMDEEVSVVKPPSIPASYSENQRTDL